MAPIRLRSFSVSVYRVPIETPVQTSFGVLRDRAAVVVRAVDDDGCEGWGEIGCNFPTVGAEHRATLCAETVAPLAWPEVSAGQPDWSSAVLRYRRAPRAATRRDRRSAQPEAALVQVAAVVRPPLVVERAVLVAAEEVA